MRPEAVGNFDLYKQADMKSQAAICMAARPRLDGVWTSILGRHGPRRSAGRRR
ncbi:hypothetical protein SAMCCGM7_Ch1575 [Sinorhizobium americanum CCGM7]|nr:hypothetical protein SAMCCGM7_Ch1575 [Sinorhizobium americanum CCGM7]